MRVFINRIYDKNQNETGLYFWGFEGSEEITPQGKHSLENKAIDYVSNNHYPNTTLSIFKDLYPKQFSLLVIKDLDSIPFDILEL